MLLKPNYQVYTADNVESGLRILREKSPDAIISDIRMPGTSGIDGLRQIRAIDPHVAVIMLTGFGALETAKEALRLGANDYISKPFDAREMREVIGRNVERTRAQRTGVNASAEIKELNSRLLRELAQKERLASLGQASAEFVHDLGNPLTIVWGYVQILAKKLEQSEKENGSAKPTSAKELNIIEQNVRLCRELLTMWQSYGSLEASPHKPISLAQIVCQVVKGVGPMAVENGVDLQCDVCDDPCTLVGDSVQIMRAIQNVIINAIQASSEKKGPVAVSCTRKDFYVDVRVADGGHGIAPAQMAKIFDPYFTTKQGKSGTGLGLYITKKVVEDHAGSIKVDSTPQTGATFTIRLPLLDN
jgi:signal transduction histidine kinase